MRIQKQVDWVLDVVACSCVGPVLELAIGFVTAQDFASAVVSVAVGDSEYTAQVALLVAECTFVAT